MMGNYIDLECPKCNCYRTYFVKEIEDLGSCDCGHKFTEQDRHKSKLDIWKEEQGYL